MATWIKLHRGLLDSTTFSNPITLKVWIWVLLKANWKDKVISTSSGRGFIDVKLKRGQLIFGRKIAAQELETSESALYRHIHKLQDMGNIIIEPNSHYSIITVCKYDVYQKFIESDEQPNVQANRQATEQATDGAKIQQMDTSIEGIEYKEGKEEEGDFDFLTKKEQAMIIPKMQEVWDRYIPAYEHSKELDYHALLNIAYRIASAKEWRRSSVLNEKESHCLLIWENIVKFIASHSFFRTNKSI